jgi:hypothetical protein
MLSIQSEKGNTPGSPLGAGAAGVAQSIPETTKGPSGAEDGSWHGVPETGDEKSAKDAGLVFGEVGVGTLGCGTEWAS